MKTKDYIVKFKMDLPGYEFNRNKFMEALNGELVERITSAREKDPQFNYDKFSHIVREMETKFWSISNKKAGQPFSENLWKAFFAAKVIPLRKELFPEVHEKIEAKRKSWQEKQAKLQAEKGFVEHP